MLKASRRTVWVYDLRTNQRSDRTPDGRWRAYTYDEILARDKTSLDLFWLRDESREDSANLPEPHVIVSEIADDLRAALEQIEDVLEDLQERAKAISARSARSSGA
jgi:type I restriction enzyme M protein